MFLSMITGETQMKGQSRYRGAIVLLLDAALIAGGNFLMFCRSL